MWHDMHKTARMGGGGWAVAEFTEAVLVVTEFTQLYGYGYPYRAHTVLIPYSYHVRLVHAVLSSSTYALS